MRKEQVSLRFEDKTACLDITKLERETYQFLYIGFIIGIAFISSLELIYLFRKPAYYITAEISIRKPIRVELITIPPETETPVIEQKEYEDKQIFIEEKKGIEPPVAEIADSLEQIIPEELIESILRQPRFPQKFPDLANGNDFLETEKPVQDTLKPPPWTLYPKQPPEPEKKTLIPPEKVKDERRRFRYDIFGIPLDGVGFVPIHFGRHAAKMVVWEIQDIFKKRKFEEVRISNFTVITEKELRFMILLWRDGLLNPYKLSRHDRLFIIDLKHGHNEIMTNEMYLLGMEKRGLVLSLVVDGDLVFRANFTREEILQTFYSIYQTQDEQGESEKHADINEYVELIKSCYNDSTGKVIIP